MKLNSFQISQHVAKKIAPIYLVSGDEPLLAEEVLDVIRAAVIQAGFAERIRIPVESGAEWGKLFFSHAQTLSLFSSKRLLELDLTTSKLTAVNNKMLQEYASHPVEDTVLLIRTNKLDSKTEQSAWYKAIDKAGVTIPIWPISIEQLPAWILQRAKKINLNLTKNAAECLAAQVEGNLLAAAQELEKLRLLPTMDVIDQQTIENVVTDNAHFDIFVLVDSALAGNSKRCLRIIDNLAAEDIEPTLILWGLTREIRTMAAIAKQVQQGTALGTLFSQFRIWEKRQPNVRAFLKRHTQESCWDLLIKAAEVDRIIKGAETGNAWNSLKALAVLCQHAPSRDH